MTPGREEWDDPHAHLDDASRELVARVVRLAISNTPHRLVCRFDLVDGFLGVAVRLERRHFLRWATVRPETWIPMGAHFNATLSLLLHVGEHGRLPDLNSPEEKSP